MFCCLHHWLTDELNKWKNIIVLHQENEVCWGESFILYLNKEKTKKFIITVQQCCNCHMEYCFSTDELSLMPFGETHQIDKDDYDSDTEESHPIEQRFSIGSYHTITPILDASIEKFMKKISILKTDIELLKSSLVGLSARESHDRHMAALRIQKNCRRWLWEPCTNDGKQGINLRLLIRQNDDLLQNYK